MANHSQLLALTALVGGLAAPLGQAAPDPNVQTFVVDASNREAVDALMDKLGVAARGGATYTLTDFVAMMHFAPGEKEKLAEAYPAPFVVSCERGTCNSTNAGTPARGRTVSSDPVLNDVDLGVSSSISSRYVRSVDGKTATICDITGMYFARLAFRKNLKALRIEIPEETGGRVVVWLAGAAEIPTCTPAPES